MLDAHDPSPISTPNDSVPVKPPRGEIEAVVIDTLAELTRYPRDILTLDADLDADLGIDSLKRIEIVDALLGRLGRAPPDDPSELGDPPRTVGELVEVAVREVAKTADLPSKGMLIGAASGLVRENAGVRGAAPAPAGRIAVTATPRTIGSGRNGAGASTAPSHTLSEIETIVIDAIAEATRYPRDILVPDARFDEDLGIDSLKRTEILTNLLERLGQPQADIEEFRPLPLSIRELTALAFAGLNARVPSSPPTPTAEGRESGPDLLVRARSSLADLNVAPIFGLRGRDLRQPFEGQIALVSDVSEGAGSAIARRMAALGAHVIVTSASSVVRGEASAKAADLGAAVYLPGSCAKGKDVERIFAEIETRFGRLDQYVYNVSGGGKETPRGSAEEQWDEVLRSNIWGYRLSATRAAKLMAKSGGGHIVALSSQTEESGLQSAVCKPARAAFESLTRELAHELAPSMVSVNAISFRRSAHAIPYAPEIDAFEEVTEAALFLLTRDGRKVNASILRFDEILTSGIV